ncbi:MAG: hypothetical protein IJN54_04755 [Lachnospiraceae bacterium]|nr:hypothetical protein [Lachnospiraceae bacterium]
MRRLKTIEELNMEVTVELTAEEKTEAFKAWVIEKIDVCETFLSIAMHNLDYSLNEREPIADHLFDGKFRFVYFTINNYIKEAGWKCEEGVISGDVLADAVKEFKQMKCKVRKAKAEYKQKFAELKASIRVAKENCEYVEAVTRQVEKLITDWCSTYVIINYFKAKFEGDRLSKTIESVTDWILSTKLNPSNEDVAVFVERFMRNHTEIFAF